MSTVCISAGSKGTTSVALSSSMTVLACQWAVWRLPMAAVYQRTFSPGFIVNPEALPKMYPLMVSRTLDPAKLMLTRSPSMSRKMNCVFFSRLFGSLMYFAIFSVRSPLAIPKGSKLEAVAHYDNSANNASNPDPNKEVHWGEQTWDEMQYTGINYTVDNESPKQRTDNQ